MRSIAYTLSLMSIDLPLPKSKFLVRPNLHRFAPTQFYLVRFGALGRRWGIMQLTGLGDVQGCLLTVEPSFSGKLYNKHYNAIGTLV
jgi:hypothetical protein